MLGNDALNQLNHPGEIDPILGRPLRVPIFNDGEVGYDAFPVTFDFTDSASQDQFGSPQYGRTLHDLTSGQEYRLRRLVGKVHAAPVVGVELEDKARNCPAVHFAVGFIVLKTDDHGNPHANFDEVNPLSQDSADDPWIWRRVWTMSTYNKLIFQSGVYSTTGVAQYFITEEQLAGLAFPNATTDFGSVADGPHIDAKTARVIGRQERLYCVTATRVWKPDGEAQYNQDGFVWGHLDLRALASLRTGMGNRRNASR